MWWDDYWAFASLLFDLVYAMIPWLRSDDQSEPFSLCFMRLRPPAKPLIRSLAQSSGNRCILDHSCSFPLRCVVREREREPLEFLSDIHQRVFIGRQGLASECRLHG
jgi:hypothetical protein